MENLTITIASAECGYTPVMPFIGKRTDGTECAKQLKLCVELAALRCGFDVTDVRETVKEPQDVILPANRSDSIAAVVLSYAAFGSRKNFNDISGCVVHHSPGRFYNGSRTLCEDVCSKLLMLRDACTAPDGNLGGANCKTAVIDAGYLTYFDEAKLAVDPDRTNQTAEHIIMGVCENFGMPYILREDVDAYPVFSGSATGKRGVKIKLVQAALAANGYDVEIDGIFGKATELAFRTFCVNNDVQTSGVTSEFWNKALLLEKRPIAIGSKSAEARYVTRKLRAKLYNATQTDVFDDDTLHALNEFLTENGKARLTNGDIIESSTYELLSNIGGCRPRLF